MPAKKRLFENVYQFKITLREIRPPIWRRIQVPETCSFWDLHVAIQDAMGWTDAHLHEFRMRDPRSGGNVDIGYPNEFSGETLLGWRTAIADFFSPENPRAVYTYDFGDDWEHLVVLEKILPKEPGIPYPRCIKGKRACPPEDIGGVWGYYDLLEDLKNPGARDGDEDEWDAYEFDPEEFDCADVSFDDPKKRLKYAGEIGLL
ncbi:plasmid pRiA4b ORF-3 family protein [Methanoculleus sp. FWC-SCC1]|uniref:Plasmid pRiA4b ORF-3 family protein n=1 Tax=Methanoculleus frigidifontis TaxID=2584085 RepID=A0ABT8M8A2_9EURY|nr:plasmid pRiA4b ORF-3 family protein [Methanoculleus sp. FWC-SCC1]MDN7024153.1 plasmid pRiA4b ORF-3 family protein [Methanoculleus sp. FWC-SCC1]